MYQKCILLKHEYVVSNTHNNYITFDILGIDCGSLDAPDNGAVNMVSSNVESIARYQCNSGFVLVGENSRTCLISGVWSDSDPICQGKIND